MDELGVEGQCLNQHSTAERTCRSGAEDQREPSVLCVTKSKPQHTDEVILLFPAVYGYKIS